MTMAVCVYLPYPILVGLSGDGPAFVHTKLSGVSRLAGLIKITGWRPGGPSFVDAVMANLEQFGTTYTLLLLGLVALGILLRSSEGEQRLLAFWTWSAYLLIAYCTAFGTLEEQFFYFLMVPVVLAVGVAGAVARRSIRFARSIRFVEAAFSTIFVVWASFIWIRVHLTPDNGYEEVRAYLRTSVPPGAHIGATTEPAEFLLDQYVTGVWRSVDDLDAHRAQYVLLSSRQIATGYALGSPEMFEWVEHNGRVVFEFRGPTNGSLALYLLPEDWWEAKSAGERRGQIRAADGHVEISLDRLTDLVRARQQPLSGEVRARVEGTA
jgi:hypothetical protein